MKGYVYILAPRRNGTLYTGVTSDLPSRLYEHQNELTPGFTSRYGVKTLVWFEEHDLLLAAITREKTIKKWPRQWKLNVIKAMNPDWDDISHYLHGLLGHYLPPSRPTWRIRHITLLRLSCGLSASHRGCHRNPAASRPRRESEPHRVCRSLQLLREWSHHEQDNEQVFT